MTKMADESTSGNLSAFSGMFHVTDLNERDTQASRPATPTCPQQPGAAPLPCASALRKNKAL